jgi:hypothetical protein
MGSVDTGGFHDHILTHTTRPMVPIYNHLQNIQSIVQPTLTLCKKELSAGYWRRKAPVLICSGYTDGSGRTDGQAAMVATVRVSMAGCRSPACRARRGRAGSSGLRPGRGHPSSAQWSPGPPTLHSSGPLPAPPGHRWFILLPLLLCTCHTFNNNTRSFGLLSLIHKYCFDADIIT